MNSRMCKKKRGTKRCTRIASTDMCRRRRPKERTGSHFTLSAAWAAATGEYGLPVGEEQEMDLRGNMNMCNTFRAQKPPPIDPSSPLELHSIVRYNCYGLRRLQACRYYGYLNRPAASLSKRRPQNRRSRSGSKKETE